MKDTRDWARQYRVAKQLWHYQIVRLDHEDAAALRAIAKRDHTSVAELIRTFVTWGLEEYEGQQDQIRARRRQD